MLQLHPSKTATIPSSIFPVVPSMVRRQLALSAILSGYYDKIPTSINKVLKDRLHLVPIKNKFALFVLRKFVLGQMTDGKEHIEGEYHYTPLVLSESLPDYLQYWKPQMEFRDISILLGIIYDNKVGDANVKSQTHLNH